MTPEMWLDLEPIPHRASCNSPQIAKFPRGFSTVRVALQLAWHDISRSTCFHAVVQARHGGQGSGLPGPDESDPPPW